MRRSAQPIITSQQSKSVSRRQALVGALSAGAGAVVCGAAVSRPDSVEHPLLIRYRLAGEAINTFDGSEQSPEYKAIEDECAAAFDAILDHMPASAGEALALAAAIIRIEFDDGPFSNYDWMPLASLMQRFAAEVGYHG